MLPGVSLANLDADADSVRIDGTQRPRRVHREARGMRDMAGTG
jgi:hypothetical protein